MRIGGTNYQASNLSAAAYPNGAGISSFFEVPAFVSNTDLHIKNVCNDEGWGPGKEPIQANPQCALKPARP